MSEILYFEFKFVADLEDVLSDSWLINAIGGYSGFQTEVPLEIPAWEQDQIKPTDREIDVPLTVPIFIKTKQ